MSSRGEKKSSSEFRHTISSNDSGEHNTEDHVSKSTSYYPVAETDLVHGMRSSTSHLSAWIDEQLRDRGFVPNVLQRSGVSQRPSSLGYFIAEPADILDEIDDAARSVDSPSANYYSQTTFSLPMTQIMRMRQVEPSAGYSQPARRFARLQCTTRTSRRRS